MAPRETEDNAYANFWGDKQRALWYAMVFSGVVNISQRFCSLVGNDGGLVVYFYLFIYLPIKSSLSTEYCRLL